MRRLLTLLSILAALAACRSLPHDARIAASASSPPAPPPVLHIEGKAWYLERIALEGAQLELIVIDEVAADTGDRPDASVARVRFDHLAGPPYAFAFDVDRARVRGDAGYSVRAQLRDAQKRLRFMTPARVAIVPGQKLDLRLVRVPLP